MGSETSSSGPDWNSRDDFHNEFSLSVHWVPRPFVGSEHRHGNDVLDCCLQPLRPDDPLLQRGQIRLGKDSVLCGNNRNMYVFSFLLVLFYCLRRGGKLVYIKACYELCIPGHRVLVLLNQISRENI